MDFLGKILDYLRVNGDTVVDALVEHVWLALLPVLIAFVLSLPLGWAAVRNRWVRRIMLTVSSVLYTIPSLALILLIPVVVGTSILDPVNVVVALAIYSLALLVRTSADGLQSVDPATLTAADAMGYRPTRRWLAVELPLSMPVVLAGLRVATVANVSMVSVAALIGGGGLGTLFTRGVQLGFYAPPIVIGLVLSVVVAVAADLVIVLVQRSVTPWSRVGRA
jgi:osmoprotectant transport system permease protein